MIADYKNIKLLEINSNILLVTINRPHVANAFNSQTAEEIFHLFKSLIPSFNNFRAIIVTGAGDKAFCAGGDLKERLGMQLEDWKEQHVKYEKMINSILNCRLPVVGAINGAAFGGGCEIVAALDYAYASSTAKFAQTETKLGIIPGIGGTQNLSRAIGAKRAKELILSARTFSAEEALSWGLINEVFPPEILLQKTIESTSLIVKNAPIAVRAAKKAIDKGLQVSLEKGMAIELQCYNETIPTNDRQEGVLAFNEGRNPNFEGK